MAGKKVTVVISQAQGKNPAKRHLEEELAARLLLDPDVDVSLVPHLYDLSADHTGMLFLKSVPGDMIVLSWLFPRAARWVLDRNGVKGQSGVSLLKPADDDEDETAGDQDGPPPEEPERPNALGAWDVPKRKIYCIDLRGNPDPAVYLDEIRRIARESSVQTVDLMSWINGSPKAEQLQRYLNPSVPGSAGNGHAPAGTTVAEPATGTATAEEPVRRRWYPVIDYSRCTNCMECIDFCLFGVYGLDSVDRILVEQQDNCKKGCPACSRVCPENAIIFPEHKTPGIAGADVGSVSGLKIDLSRLFGAPSALEEAVLERDAELVRDGRDAVGMSVGLPKRQAGKAPSHDRLDDLMDGLDQLDL
jgi:NAD-dependent dihydropyrimidine dehydrogenase PreA subunit